MCQKDWSGDGRFWFIKSKVPVHFQPIWQSRDTFPELIYRESAKNSWELLLTTFEINCSSSRVEELQSKRSAIVVPNFTFNLDNLWFQDRFKMHERNSPSSHSVELTASFCTVYNRDFVDVPGLSSAHGLDGALKYLPYMLLAQIQRSIENTSRPTKFDR